MHSIKVSPVFLSTIILLSPLIAAHLNVINEFQENVSLKPGDVFQCEVTKTNLDETSKSNTYSVLTQACVHDKLCYVYHETSEKCFSFKLKTSKIPCIVFGHTPYVSGGNAEIVLDWGGNAYVRQRGPNTGIINVKIKPITGVVNENEYRGFWVRWADDELLEIGRENEIVPFLEHRFPKKLQISYIGIMSWTVPAAWIIDKDPKCPSTDGSKVTEASNELRVQSECMFLE